MGIDTTDTADQYGPPIVIDVEEMEELGQVRRAAHRGRSSRELSSRYEEIGVAGELAFEQWSGITMDRSARPRGDTLDFLINGWQLDVKTFERPDNLLVEQGRVRLDVYVLAGFKAPDCVTLIGWEWGQTLRHCPARDFGYQIVNHYKAAHLLRPMDALLSRLKAKAPFEHETAPAEGKLVTPRRMREIMLDNGFLTDGQRLRLRRELSEMVETE